MNSVSTATNGVAFWRAQNWASASLSLISAVTLLQHPHRKTGRIAYVSIVVPTEAGTHFCRGYRPSPPWHAGWSKLATLGHGYNIKNRATLAAFTAAPAARLTRATAPPLPPRAAVPSRRPARAVPSPPLGPPRPACDGRRPPAPRPRASRQSARAAPGRAPGAAPRAAPRRGRNRW